MEASGNELVEEVHQCAFCQEELHKENFVQGPFGNFIYCQSSRLLYHSVEQTLRSHEKALQNEDLALQFQGGNKNLAESQDQSEQDHAKQFQSSSAAE